MCIAGNSVFMTRKEMDMICPVILSRHKGWDVDDGKWENAT